MQGSSGQVRKGHFESVRSGSFRIYSQMHNEFLTMSVINDLSAYGGKGRWENPWLEETCMSGSEGGWRLPVRQW